MNQKYTTVSLALTTTIDADGSVQLHLTPEQVESLTKQGLLAEGKRAGRAWFDAKTNTWQFDPYAAPGTSTKPIVKNIVKVGASTKYETLKQKARVVTSLPLNLAKDAAVAYYMSDALAVVEGLKTDLYKPVPDNLVDQPMTSTTAEEKGKVA